MIEPLERRTFFDIALTGGPGHAGVMLDVQGAGTLQVDYYLRSWYEQRGILASGCLAEGPAAVKYAWSNRALHSRGALVVKTVPAEDAQGLAWLHDNLSGPNPDWLRLGPTSYEYVTSLPATEWYSTYSIDRSNCYTLAGLILDRTLTARADLLHVPSPFPTIESLPHMWSSVYNDLKDWVSQYGLIEPVPCMRWLPYCFEDVGERLPL